MAGNFDPYHKWLGIPQKDQPPNHYRLLGIEVFESDRDVIDAAANRVMSYLHELSVGADAQAAQRLLNEVSAARLCLLTPPKKAGYDEVLRAQLRPASPPVRAVGPPPLAQPAARKEIPLPAMPAPMARPIASPMPAPVARPIPSVPAARIGGETTVAYVPPPAVDLSPGLTLPSIVTPSPPSAPTIVSGSLPAKASGGSTLAARKRKKAGSLVAWLIGGGLTTTIIVVVIVLAANFQLGRGTIYDEMLKQNEDGANANSRPASLIIKMRDTDRAGASITINGEKKVVPASGPIKYSLPAGMLRVVITHADHETIDEPLGIGPGREFVLPVNW